MLSFLHIIFGPYNYFSYRLHLNNNERRTDLKIIKYKVDCQLKIGRVSISTFDYLTGYPNVISFSLKPESDLHEVAASGAVDRSVDMLKLNNI